MTNVTLRYKRIETRFVGALDDVQHDWASFAAMMTDAHRRLVECPEAGLLIAIDVPGALPMQLEPVMLKLLREDPVGYIDKHSVPHRIIDLSGGKRQRRLVESKVEIPRRVGLRTGHDALAENFGDRVYLNLTANGAGGGYRVEHPASGRWTRLQEFGEWLAEDGDTMETHVVADGRGWVTVPVEALLQRDVPHFFLPREWNRHGIWISREQLRALHEQFIKERDDAGKQQQ